MRIVYLHQYFNTPESSSGIRSYEMARRMVLAGHEVLMITSERKGRLSAKAKWYQTEEAGIQVYWTPVLYGNHMGYHRRLKSFFQYAWRAARKAASLEADIIFATSTPLTIALPAVYASRRRKIPLVFEVRDLWPELPIAVGALSNPLAVAAARWMERFAYRNSNSVVTLSSEVKTGVLKTGYPENRVSVIPNSCDLELFDVDPALGDELRKRYHWLLDRPLVVYIGTFGIINGVDYLARLAAAVRNIDFEIRFVAIGGGKEEDKLRRVAEELAVLNQNFFIFGRIPKNEVPIWLSAADIPTSLFINLKEMWSNSANKFFDALAAGKPVAINYGGWQEDLIRETGTGLLLDPEDVDASAAALVRVIRDKAWMYHAGKAAKELARERFSRDYLARELTGVLEEAVRAKERSH